MRPRGLARVHLSASACETRSGRDLPSSPRTRAVNSSTTGVDQPFLSLADAGFRSSVHSSDHARWRKTGLFLRCVDLRLPFRDCPQAAENRDVPEHFPDSSVTGGCATHAGEPRVLRFSLRSPVSAMRTSLRATLCSARRRFPHCSQKRYVMPMANWCRAFRLTPGAISPAACATPKSTFNGTSATGTIRTK